MARSALPGLRILSRGVAMSVLCHRPAHPMTMIPQPDILPGRDRQRQRQAQPPPCSPYRSPSLATPPLELDLDLANFPAPHRPIPRAGLRSRCSCLTWHGPFRAPSCSFFSIPIPLQCCVLQISLMHLFRNLRDFRRKSLIRITVKISKNTSI